jgi:ketosteroid isomerase-like protein
VSTTSNVDVARSIHEAWQRGDFSSRDWADPEIEIVYPDGPSPGRWHGVAGMAEASRDWLRAWDDWRFEVDEIRELDDDRVLVLVSYGGRGRSSGLSVEQLGVKGAQLFHLRAGRVTRFVRWIDHQHALADLGLSSQANST